MYRYTDMQNAIDSFYGPDGTLLKPVNTVNYMDNDNHRNREMALQLQTLAVLPEDPGSVFRTHRVVYKHV